MCCLELCDPASALAPEPDTTPVDRGRAGRRGRDIQRTGDNVGDDPVDSTCPERRLHKIAPVTQDGCPSQRAFVLALSLGSHRFTGCGSHAVAAGVLDAGLADPALPC